MCINTVYEQGGSGVRYIHLRCFWYSTTTHELPGRGRAGVRCIHKRSSNGVRGAGSREGGGLAAMHAVQRAARAPCCRACLLCEMRLGLHTGWSRAGAGPLESLGRARSHPREHPRLCSSHVVVSRALGGRRYSCPQVIIFISVGLAIVLCIACASRPAFIWLTAEDNRMVWCEHTGSTLGVGAERRAAAGDC